MNIKLIYLIFIIPVLVVGLFISQAFTSKGEEDTAENLYQDASNIYLNQIVDAIDEPPPIKEQCSIGLDLCSDDVPCPIHHTWKPIRKAIREMLASENLEELAHRVIEKRKLMNS